MEMHLADMKYAVEEMGMEDLKGLYEILKARVDTLQRKTVQLFSEGDKVYFVDRGTKYFGVVKKINQKSITVDCKSDERGSLDKSRTICRVSANMLKKGKDTH